MRQQQHVMWHQHRAHSRLHNLHNFATNTNTHAQHSGEIIINGQLSSCRSHRERLQTLQTSNVQVFCLRGHRKPVCVNFVHISQSCMHRCAVTRAVQLIMVGESSQSGVFGVFGFNTPYWPREHQIDIFRSVRDRVRLSHSQP